MKGSFHPDVRLRHGDAIAHQSYDGSVHIETPAQLIGVDGTPLGVAHAHAHRVAPNRWHGLTFPQMIAEAIMAHYEALGLTLPDLNTLYHLHPRGFPGTQAYAPVPETPPPTPYDPAALRDHIIAATSAEMGVALDPADHPLTKEQP